MITRAVGFGRLLARAGLSNIETLTGFCWHLPLSELQLLSFDARLGGVGIRNPQ